MHSLLRQRSTRDDSCSIGSFDQPYHTSPHQLFGTPEQRQAALIERCEALALISA